MKYKVLFITVALATIFSACSSKDQMQDSISGENSLSFAEGLFEFSPLGSSCSLFFTSDANWTLTSTDSWVQISKSSGREGTYVVTIQADVNRTRQERSAVISLINERTGEIKDLSVRQPFPYLRMTVSDSERTNSIVNDTVHIAWNMSEESMARSQNIHIESNIDWKIDTTDVFHGANFRFSALSGNGDADVTLSAIMNNLDKSPYSAEFRLSGYLGKDSDQIIGDGVDTYAFDIFQKNLKLLINNVPNNAEIEISEINENVGQTDIIVESELAWTLVDCPDWIIADKTSGQPDEIVNIHFSANGVNPSREVRDCVVKVETSVGASRLVDIKQRAYVLSLNQNAIILQNDDLESHEVKLNTTGNWKILNVPSWADVSPLEGEGSAVLSVRCLTQNLDFDDLNSVIKVQSTMNDLFEDIDLTQNKFIFNVSSPAALSDMPTMSTTSYDVIIESSGAWEIMGKPSWIDISSLGSDTKGTFSLKVGPNSGNPDMSMDRLAVLEVVSLAHKRMGKDISKTITIKQRKYIFNVSKASFDCFKAYRSDSQSATVKCSAAWTVTTPNWITSSTTSGDGTTDMEVSFAPKDNIQRTKRVGKIIVTSTYNNEVHEIQVEQDAFEFDSSEKNYTVPAMNTSVYPVSFALTENAGWRLTEGNEKWLNASAVSGTGTSTVTFTPDPNPALVGRSATISILSEVSGEIKKVSFQQEPFVFDSKEETLFVTELDESPKIVSVICSGPWIIKGSPEWLTISPESGSGNADILITPAKNLTHNERTASLTLTSTINDLKKVIKLCQSAFKFDSSSESFHYAASEIRTDYFDVICSGAWTAAGVPDWVTLSKLSGVGNQNGTAERLTLVSSMNNTTEARSAVIKISSVDNPSEIKTINISQDKFVFEVDKNEVVFSDPLDVTAHSVTLKTSSGWTVSSDQPWLNVMPLSGEGNAEINIVPSKNDSPSERVANVTISSTVNDAKIIVIVKQAGYVVDSTPESFDVKSAG